MADQFKAEVDLALKAPDAKNLEQTLTNILNAVDKLPGKGKAASGAVAEIVGQIQKIRTALESTGSLNSVIQEVKVLGASLKGLSALTKGLELFSNKDIDNINRGTTAIRQAASAYDAMQREAAIRKGTFGLDETKIAGVIKASKSLQTELNAIKQSMAVINGDGSKPRVNANDPLYQKLLLIQKNLSALENYRVSLQKQMDMEKYARDMAKQGDAMKTQFYTAQAAMEKKAQADRQKAIDDNEKLQKIEAKRLAQAQDGRKQAANMTEAFARSSEGQQAYQNRAAYQITGTARFANQEYLQNQVAQRERADQMALNRAKLEGLGIRTQDLKLSQQAALIAQQIRKLEADLTQELIRGNGETQRSLELRQKIMAAQAQMKIQKSQDADSDPLLKQAREQSRLDAMMSRTTGAGGAALLRVQAMLMANYGLLTTMVNGFQSAVRESIQLEAAFRNIQAVTATTTTEMAGLEMKIKGVAATSKFSATEVADAALILGQAGLSAKQVADALPSVVTLATAAGTTLANAVDLVTSIVGVFDKQASDTAEVANKVTAAANNSKISVEKLALAFQYTGNAAAQTGVSFEEVTAALAAMSNAGIKSGSTMGTGFRQFITELQKPSEEFLATLRRVGLGISDVDVRSHGLVGVLRNLRDAGFVASDAIRSFDVRGAAAFNAMVADPDAVEKQLQMLQNTKAAVEANEIQMQSFDSQSKRLGTTLNNVVSVGLAPLQTAMTSVMRVSADTLGTLAQYEGAWQLLITGATAFIAVGITRHLAGLALGYAALSGSTALWATSLRGLTTMTVGQALAQVSLTGTLAGSTAGLAAWGAGLVRTTVLAYSLGGATGLLTGALRGLMAVLGSMSVMTGIGLVIGAIAVAMYAWEDQSEKTKKKLDELKAASNDAKAAFTDKTTTISLLTKKIEELQYKEGSLSSSQDGLKNTARDLQAQFGSLGLQLDENNLSYSDMITKLRQVRSEMSLLADQKLKVQIKKDEDLLGTQKEQLSDTLGSNSGGRRGAARNAAGYLERFVRQNGLMNGLSAGQQSAINSGLQTYSEAGNAGFLDREGSAAALVKASNALDAIRVTLTTDAQRKEFEKYAKPLYLASEQAGNVANQQMSITGSRNQLEMRRSMEAALAMPIFGGKTFEQAMPAVYNVDAAQRAKGVQGNEFERYNSFKEEINRNIAALESGRNTIRDSKLAPAIADELVTQINQRIEQFRSMGRNQFATIEQRYKEEGQAEIAKQNAIGSNRNRPMDERREARLRAGEIGQMMALAGAYGSNERAESMARLRMETAQEKANSLRDTGGGSVEKGRFALQGKALTAQAELFDAQAKGDMINAKTAASVEELDRALDDFVAKKVRAKEKRLEALVLEQNSKVLPKDQDEATKKANAEAVKAESQTLDEKIKNDLENAVSLYRAAYKRNYKSGAKFEVEQRVRELNELRSNSEDTIYEATQPGTNLRKEVAMGTLYEGSTEIKKADLNAAVVKMNELGKELTFLSKFVTDLQARVAEAKKNLDDAEDAYNKASPEGRALAGAKRDAARAEYADVSGQLRSATKERNKAREGYDNSQIDVYQRSQAVPKELNAENLSGEMDKVLARYQQSVNEFDQVGNFAAGIEQTLLGLGGNFSALFSNILSGSMSAGQAFRQFANGIIKSMLDIITQALAMAAIKQLLGWIGLGSAGFGAGAGIGSAGTTNGSAGTGTGAVYAAEGGEMTGGIAGRDSIPVMAMPGEFMLKKAAVDAIGVDYLHQLNNQSDGALRNSASGASNSGGRSNSGGQGDVTNIWLVTPDQQQTIGPKDIVMTIQDHLDKPNTGLRMLIKSIATGQQ